MKTFCLGTTFLLITAGAPLLAQQPPDENACKFTVSESKQKATIAGPDEIVRLVRVVQQPDSPIEILAVDFKDSWSARNGNNFTERTRFKARVRNRSDKPIRGLSVVVWKSPGGLRGGYGTLNAPLSKPLLSPGEEIELQSAGSGGSGAEPEQDFQLLVSVDWVSFEGCQFYPSLRLPLKVEKFSQYWHRSLLHP